MADAERVLLGKTIVVTGAANGLGRAYAVALAQVGANVIVNDWGRDVSGKSPADEEPAESVAAAIRSDGGRAIASPTDVSDPHDAERMIKLGVDTFGRIDGVINNAGVGYETPFESVSLDDFHRMIDTHLVGTFLVSRAAVAHWRQRSNAGEEVDARLINTTSSAGHWGIVGGTAYNAAKGGVIAMSLGMAAELAPLGVAVNTIAPGAASRMMPGASRDPMEAATLVCWLMSRHAYGVTGRAFENVKDVWLLDGWRRSLMAPCPAGSNFDEFSLAMKKALRAAPTPQGPINLVSEEELASIPTPPLVVAPHDWQVVPDEDEG